MHSLLQKLVYLSAVVWVAGLGGGGLGGGLSGILKQFHPFITSFAKPVFEKI